MMNLVEAVWEKGHSMRSLKSPESQDAAIRIVRAYPCIINVYKLFIGISGLEVLRSIADHSDYPGTFLCYRAVISTPHITGDGPTPDAAMLDLFFTFQTHLASITL